MLAGVPAETVTAITSVEVTVERATVDLLRSVMLAVPVLTPVSAQICPS